MTDKFSYKLEKTSGDARLGEITTPRGNIRTPAFMPVGTAATVKAMFPGDVKEAGADVLLCNTYHLMLRPGAERVASYGGLHGFMNWQGPILTDSGGFQVMSLSKLAKLTEDGVTFQSHLDGSKHNLTPERSIEIQCLLGSDIQMQFDECTAFPCEREVAEKSMELSLRWAKRSKEAFQKYANVGSARGQARGSARDQTRGKTGGQTGGQALFGIVQGSVYQDLRERSAHGLMELDFHGYSIGGLAVGEGQEIMFDTLSHTLPHLPKDKPRYLMGVGTPLDIIGAVERGIDMFDCVMPTRSGRHGQAFTWDGPINLRNAKHKDDMQPIDAASLCPAARDYSRAYLNHLIKAGEYLAPMLLTMSNVWFYQDLMAAIRASIKEGRFADFAREFRARYEG